MFPPEPDVPDAQRGAAQGRLRYEDLAQDGRMLLTSVPHFLGVALWQQSVGHDPTARAAARAGIVPITTRFLVEGDDGPLSVSRPVDARGCYQLAHTVDERGEVNRILLNMWLTVTGPAGRTHGPPPPNAGQPVRAGRLFVEHVFTRLFAPPEQRKVLALPGLEGPPPERYEWRPGESLLALPAGAVPLDDDLASDETPVVFGLTHTDSNHHVNSLVYPRLFEDAALRRFAARGRGVAVLARRVDIAYRKPCFAGETYRIVLRAFEDSGGLGAVGAFVPAAGGRAHCHLSMTFQ